MDVWKKSCKMQRRLQPVPISVQGKGALAVLPHKTHKTGGAKPRGIWVEVQSTMYSDAQSQRMHRRVYDLLWSCGSSSEEFVVIASRPFG